MERIGTSFDSEELLELVFKSKKKNVTEFLESYEQCERSEKQNFKS
jgi:hypothetical protein